MQRESIWALTSNKGKTFPELSGEKSADVVIVGAGISGLTCAYMLSNAGKKVIVAEGRSIGLGTTGHSTGNLYSTVESHLSTLISTWGKDTAKQVVSSRSLAIGLIENLVTTMRIDCDFRRVPLHHFSEKIEQENKAFFESEFEAAKELGLPANFNSSASLPFKTTRSLTLENQAQFHPLNYVRGIAQTIAGSVEIFEHSPAIDFDAKQGSVTCPKGTIKADHIVFATHVPKGTDPVQLRLEPIREHGVAAPFKGNPFHGIFWRADQPKRSVRTITANGTTYVMAIGTPFKTGHNSDTPKENEILDEYLSSRMDIAQERYWWAAQSYRSADKLPFIGETATGIHFLTGFSADGLVYGTLGARIISDTILGRTNEFKHVFKASRVTPLKSAKTMMTQGADTMKQYLRDLPGVGTTQIDNIERGRGAVIERGGEKLAVYRDEQGQAHCVSAVCTHMKCIVTFNPAERTWDCPCHASRFALDGSVIEGPALLPLERKDV